MNRVPNFPEHNQRLNRILSSAGLTSRRKADEWITSGRVTIDGRLITDPGTKARWGVDRIEVDGQAIPDPSERLYVLLNKPFGYISSLSDPEGRPLAIDLLRDIQQRCYPVGRLDFDTLGMLLFTNDGELAHRLMHPSYRVPRTYKVKVAGEITKDAIHSLRRGIHLEDGLTGPSKVTLLRRDPGQSIIRMTIMQGKHRQVRRMLEAVGYRVVHLVRIGFGNLSLGDLKVGQYRHLDKEEIESLNRLAGIG
jgi:23S rRNA pseudouridine2605 synthase